MVLDAHSDLFYDVTRRRLAGEPHVLERYHLSRLRRGGVEGLVLSLWTGTGQSQTFWRDTPWAAPEAASSRLKVMLACAREELAECRAVRLVRTGQEAAQARKEAAQARKDGCLYVILGVEGLASLGTDLAGLEDAGQISNLFDCLERLGLSAREREGIAREIFLRLLG